MLEPVARKPVVKRLRQSEGLMVGKYLLMTEVYQRVSIV
jgi:hypothetical protein